MFYVLSIVLVVLGLVTLGTVLVKVFGALNRWRYTATMVRTETEDRLGLLRARWAALGVAVKQRRARGRFYETSEPVRSAVNQ